MTNLTEINKKARVEIGDYSFYLNVKYIIETEKYYNIKFLKIEYSEMRMMLEKFAKLGQDGVVRVFDSEKEIYSILNKEIMCQSYDPDVSLTNFFLLKRLKHETEKQYKRRTYLKFINDKLYNCLIGQCEENNN